MATTHRKAKDAIAFHSALTQPIDAPPSQRVELRGCVALVHDLVEAGPPPADFDPCDVWYVEPPWQAGGAIFDKRAGCANARPWNETLSAIIRAIDHMKDRPSYKPALVMAIMDCLDERGGCYVRDVAHRFAEFYADRLSRGLVVETPGAAILEALAQPESSRLRDVVRILRQSPLLALRRAGTLNVQNGRIELSSAIRSALSSPLNEVALRNEAGKAAALYFEGLEERPK